MIKLLLYTQYNKWNIAKAEYKEATRAPEM